MLPQVYVSRIMPQLGQVASWKVIRTRHAIEAWAPLLHSQYKTLNVVSDIISTPYMYKDPYWSTEIEYRMTYHLAIVPCNECQCWPHILACGRQVGGGTKKNVGEIKFDQKTRRGGTEKESLMVMMTKC